MKRFFTVLSLLFVVGTALVVSDMMFVNQPSKKQSSASIKPVSINPNNASLVGLQTIAPKRESELIN